MLQSNKPWENRVNRLPCGYCLEDMPGGICNGDGCYIPIRDKDNPNACIIRRFPVKPLGHSCSTTFTGRNAIPSLRTTYRKIV